MNQIEKFRKLAFPPCSQQRLALKSGLGSQSRISNYENGSRIPSLKDSRKIVQGLNLLGVKCTLDDVFPPESKKAA